MIYFKIKDLEDRIETGLTIFGEDKPGIFIRGDNFFYIKSSWETIANNIKTTIDNKIFFDIIYYVQYMFNVEKDLSVRNVDIQLKNKIKTIIKKDILGNPRRLTSLPGVNMFDGVSNIKSGKVQFNDDHPGFYFNNKDVILLNKLFSVLEEEIKIEENSDTMPVHVFYFNAVKSVFKI